MELTLQVTFIQGATFLFGQFVKKLKSYMAVLAIG
jgi:hypothetical protein